jgi:general secretion pathway protein L
MMDAVRAAHQGVAAFFGWWMHELAGLLPQRLRRVVRRERRGLILMLGRDESSVLERTSEGERLIGSVPGEAPDHDQRLSVLLRQTRGRGRPVTVRLNAELGLCKVLDLPLAAREDLHQMLGLEMDRLTPFRADEVYFAQRVLHCDPQHRRLSVELQLAPKRVVERALEVTQELDVVPTRIELSRAASDDAQPLNLLPEAVGEGRRESRLNRALALLSVVLAVIAVLIPLERQRVMLAGVEDQVALARAKAEESLELRKRLDQLSQTAQFLLAEKNGRVLVTQALAELTRLIPDQAYLIQLQVIGDRIEVQGFAKTASDLIGVLDQSPLFKMPQFRSPVTQDPRTGLERFHLSVELAGKDKG